ncbi:MAG: exodeoxyribonuclease V subunit gamma [Kofleriaceae bacterium]|nr:exodeoxyribonuclease V subunit gamma [Kofleriaceae bacterium]
MLRAVHSNRVEHLLAALAEALPAPDPFAPMTVVVGSHLVRQWLLRELAFARGISAGLELVTFDTFIERSWTDAQAELVSIDRAQLAALFASVLADGDVVRSVPAVHTYLEAAPAPGDRAGPRRVQLASQLATLCWAYATTRPDWMPALINGHVPAELAEVANARWQATLIAAAFARIAKARPTLHHALVPMLPWARRRLHLPPPALPAVAVFGMSYLTRSQLEALTDLATTTDVTVYALDPCEELWDDVAGRSASLTTADPLPLVMWGRPVRDTLGALVERTGGDLEARFADGAGDGSARERLLADVRTRGAASGAAPMSGATGEAGATDVIVHACPNARREIEAIAAAVRRRLDADPTLLAHEVGVWLAGDTERYLALAPSAFEAVGVPCHLVDAPIADRGRIGEAMLALLELPTSAMARRDLLRVMTHPAVLAGHPHVDAGDWVRWTERLGIAHGADAHAHADTYLEEYPGHFHWDQGVRRLALGAFMVGERAGRGPARIASLEVAPEELRADQQASAATYALLVRSLSDDAAWLARLEAPLATWAEVFAGLVDAYLAPRDTDATRDLERVRSMLAGLARLDLDGRHLGFREAREHAIRQLDGARANRGEPLAAGVMIAPIGAMRAVPFRIAFVAGLDEGAFPAGEHASPLDARKTPRPGDVSPRDRDRAAFLEVLLCAREELHLSYVAVEAKSGQPLGPSSVVLELADALAPYIGAGSSREALAQLTVREPLHRFTGGDAVVPAAAREKWGCEVRDAVRAHLRAHGHEIPDEDGVFALLAHPAQHALRAALGVAEPPAMAPAKGGVRTLTIANLRDFLEKPVQAWAQAVLGLGELPDDAAGEHSDEPFHLERPDRAVMLREVFASQLRDPSAPLSELYDAAMRDAQLRGQYPVGVFAEAARTVDLGVLETWRAGLGLVPVGGAARLGFGRASSQGAQLRPALELALDDGRPIRLVGQTELLVKTGDRYTSVVTMIRKHERRTPYHLRGAFDHLLLAAAGIATNGHAHKLLDHKGAAVEIVHAPWTRDDARAYLVGLITELLDEPHGYLLPFESLARAVTGAKPSRRVYGDPTGGLGYGPLDRKEGLDLPPDYLEIAQRRLAPLVQRMRGDHGFEGRGR